MKVLCISDAHLSDPDDPSYASLRHLLRNSIQDLDALLILGDLFQVWIGDNRILVRRHQSLLDIFREYRRQGKIIFYLKGNHDFIIGETLEKDIGVDVCDEEASFDWDGYRLFASHGDHIDRKDYRYRIMKTVLRSSLMGRTISLLGDAVTYRFAGYFSSVAKGNSNSEKEQKLLNLCFHYAKAKLENGFHAVVLGHTHVLQWHLFSVKGEKRLYVNPGSWALQKTYLWYDDGRFQVCKHAEPEPKVLFDFRLSVA